MGMFGWSYPAGCSGTPDDDEQTSPQAEEVWAILELAGVEESTIERVVLIVEQLAIEASRECQQCLNQHAADIQNDR